MKTNIITVGLLLAVLAIGLASYTSKSEISNFTSDKHIEISEGEALYTAKCMVCHVTSKPDDMSTLIAPPIMGVMMHIKKGIEGKNEAEKRANSIAFIVDYVQNPSAEKSMFGAHAIERFDVMPSQKENVTEEELNIIANYLYDNFPQKGMNHKKRKKGNKKGCGNGCGGNCEH
jgi:cytochrome c